jgi:S-adenosylmethionine:tRNA ribosyltransferase-isomerase
MIAADQAIQRLRDAKLLVIDRYGDIEHHARATLVERIERGDCVVANDAATLPASLAGIHRRTGQSVEVRLAARASLASDDVVRFIALVFGSGDFHARTEERAAPPALRSGDRLTLGPLDATIQTLLGHSRLVRLRFAGDVAEIWRGLAQHGRPIQYAHLRNAAELRDMWTPIAATPAAFEPPSASFVLDWKTIAALRERGARFVTLTHAAGISSTGDAALDARLPFDEPYRIPDTTARAIAEARTCSGRIIAIGTTVVRALEHAASADGSVHAGASVATQRIGPHSALRIVDVIVSGTHEPGSSHHALLSAFTDCATLQRADVELDAHGYRTHEFGDSVWIERRVPRLSGRATPRPAAVGVAQVVGPRRHASIDGSAYSVA